MDVLGPNADVSRLRMSLKIKINFNIIKSVLSFRYFCFSSFFMPKDCQRRSQSGISVSPLAPMQRVCKVSTSPFAYEGEFVKQAESAGLPAPRKQATPE